MRIQAMIGSIRVSALLVLTAVLVGCATIRTGSHYNETVNFGAYQTFSWMSDRPYVMGDPNVVASPLAQTIIQDAIRAELERAGFRYVQDSQSADVILAYTVGTRDQMTVDTYPARFRVYGGWHMPNSYFYIRESTTHSYSVGTLGVDMFENETGRPIWHGYAEKTIRDADRADPGPSIRKGVRQLFENFPE